MVNIRWAFNFRNWKPQQKDWAFVLSFVQLEEKERISRYVFKKDAKASMVGRLMLRKFASTTLGIPWNTISFSRTEKGRPFLTNILPEHQSKVDFNVSHQGDWVVLAAELSSKVGIDVMKVEKATTKDVPEFFRLMRRQFTQEEWNTIRSSDDENVQLRHFYRHWCLKEAVVKALGVGIGFELQRISFNVPTPVLQTDIVLNDTSVKIDGILDTNWYFEETALDELHPVAVAIHLEDTIQIEKIKEKDMSQFDVLTYDDLINEAIEITSLDLDMAHKFMAKEETPWS